MFMTNKNTKEISLKKNLQLVAISNIEFFFVASFCILYITLKNRKIKEQIQHFSPT